MTYTEVSDQAPCFAALKKCHFVACVQQKRCIAVPDSCLAMPVSLSVPGVVMANSRCPMLKVEQHGIQVDQNTCRSPGIPSACAWQWTASAMYSLCMGSTQALHHSH